MVDEQQTPMDCNEAYFAFVNTYATAKEMKSLLADEKVSKQAAAEADVAAQKACLRSKYLCRARREAWLRTLDNPPLDLPAADREALQRGCDELRTWLDNLNAAYPGERENEPPPATSTAKRSLL